MYCNKIKKNIYSKERKLRKRLKKKKPKKVKNKAFVNSAMAHGLPANRAYYATKTSPTANVYAHNIGFILWYACLKGNVVSDELRAKWYTPDGVLYQQEDAINKAMPYNYDGYFFLAVADKSPERMPGLWKIEVFYKDELVDTKHFYILDA